jgi:MTH538 TIR-like domain (DUF1863)
MINYDAFISYSHAKDEVVANALQQIMQKLGKPWYRRRAIRVFRDDTSLSASPHLWSSIEQALTQSRFFILLASPESAASKWVNKEVAWWLEHKSTDTLLIGITDGRLHWDEKITSFENHERFPLPPALAGRFSVEPKWIDLRPFRVGANPRDGGFINRAADFAAAIHGVPKEDLLSEETRQQRKALRLAWSTASAVLVLAGGVAWEWKSASDAEKVAEAEREVAKAQTKIAEGQTKVAETQKQIADAQKKTAEEQRDQAQITQSRFLADVSRQLQQRGDGTASTLLAIEALPDKTAKVDRPYVAEAEARAGSALIESEGIPLGP